jgi:hypothetical protein
LTSTRQDENIRRADIETLLMAPAAKNRPFANAQAMILDALLQTVWSCQLASADHQSNENDRL